MGMFLKRTSPKLTTDLAAGGLDFGDKTSFHEEIISHDSAQKQEKPSGTCDHDPLEPSFYIPPSKHKKRPNIIDEAIRAIEKAYFKPKQILSKLFKPQRVKKSSRREAIIRVLQVMLQFMDMETLEVGFYSNNGNFIRLDVNYIASQARISLIRAKRALGDILRSGYMETTRQKKKTLDGLYKSFTSIRKFAVSFFMDLGIEYLRFFSAREWKRKRNEKILIKHARKKLKGIIKSAIVLAEKNSIKESALIRRMLTMVDNAIKTFQQAFLKAKLE